MPVGLEELESDYEGYYAAGEPMEVDMEIPGEPVADSGLSLCSEFLAFAMALQDIGPLKPQQLVGNHPPNLKFAYTTGTGIC